MLKHYPRSTGVITTVVFSNNRRWLASSSFDQTIRAWNIATGKCMHMLTGHTAPVTSIFYQPMESALPNANKWQLVSGSFDQTIRQWNLLNGECTQTLTGHTGIIYSVVMFALVSKQVVFSSSFDETIKAWNLETQNCFCLCDRCVLTEGCKLLGSKA